MVCPFRGAFIFLVSALLALPAFAADIVVDAAPTPLPVSPPLADLFGRPSPAMEEVLHYSHPDLYLFTPPRSDIPNLDPRKRQKVLDIRTLVQAAVKDEELLRRFVPLDDRLMRQADYIPTLIGDIARKIGAIASEAEIGSWADTLSRSDRKTIHWYIANPQSPNPYKAIALYANEYFGTQHTLQSVDRAKKIIRGYFPSLYKEFPFRAQVESSQFAWSSEETAHFLREDGSHVFKLNTGQPPSNSRALDDLETQGLLKNGYLFRRRIADLIAMLHEYAHGIYEETVGYRPIPLSPGYYNTVDAAFNEGFAVLIETLAVRKMEQDADKLKLDQRDVADLQEFRRQRMQCLRGNSRESMGMAYTEGAVRFLYEIHKKDGIEGVRNFLLSIDRNKTLSTSRTSPEYAALLRNPGMPDHFLKGSSRALAGAKP